MDATENSYRIALTDDCRYDGGQTMFGDLHLERLTAAGIDWHFLPAIDGPWDPAALADVDAVVSFAHAAFGAALAQRLPRLRHIARYGAGFDGIDVEGLAAHGVVVTTTPAAVRRPLALAGLTLLLACADRLLENHLAATTGRWAERGDYRGVGLVGRTVGIVGFGSVGSVLAELIGRLEIDVTVVGAGPHKDNPRAAALGVPILDLDELAAVSDFVVSTASLTPTSVGMFDAAFFAAMKPTAYFINVGRGGLQVQSALTAALVGHRIAGAALDVLEKEPPAADEKLLHLDNVLVTPHALAWTDDFTSAVATSMIEAVIAASRGEIPATALRRDLIDAATWRGAAGR
ncbi:MAG: hypothetical protein FWF28_00140 [Micrococcales bacterium]|nr:hypothetical protein [Micrococcales bacterium]